VTDTTTEHNPPSPPTADVPDGPALPPSKRRRTSRRVLFVFALLVIAFVFLLVEGLGSSLDYFDTVDQALAHKSSLGTQTFRLEGTVVPGTIHATSNGTDFDICQGGASVPVTNVGSPPQLFAPRIPVVVVGHFASTASHRFDSNTIMVKHSSTYTAEHPGRVKTTSSGPVC